MKYKVTVTEVLEKSVEVEASSMEEAEEIGMQMYANQEIVLDADDFDGEATFDVEELELDQRFRKAVASFTDEAILYLLENQTFITYQANRHGTAIVDGINKCLMERPWEVKIREDYIPYTLKLYFDYVTRWILDFDYRKDWFSEEFIVSPTRENIERIYFSESLILDNAFYEYGECYVCYDEFMDNEFKELELSKEQKEILAKEVNMEEVWSYVFHIGLVVNGVLHDYYVSAKEMQDAFAILMKHLKENNLTHLYRTGYGELEYPQDYLNIGDDYFASYAIDIHTEIFNRKGE